MAEPIHFPEVNAIEDYSGGERSRPLPVKAFPTHTVSCWQFDADERAVIGTSGLVWLTTATFASLPELLDGQRHQPPVSLTAHRATALAGWLEGGSSPAPAADRIVTYDDNQQGFEEVRSSLRAVSEQLSLGNDHGNLSEEDVQQARRDILILSHAFECEAIRTGWLLGPALKCLKWIADKAVGATVGQLAMKAFDAVIRWFGP
jgi:hypothetical protein